MRIRAVGPPSLREGPWRAPRGGREKVVIGASVPAPRPYHPPTPKDVIKLVIPCGCAGWEDLLVVRIFSITSQILPNRARSEVGEVRSRLIYLINLVVKAFLISVEGPPGGRLPFGEAPGGPPGGGPCEGSHWRFSSRASSREGSGLRWAKVCKKLRFLRLSPPLKPGRPSIWVPLGAFRPGP